MRARDYLNQLKKLDSMIKNKMIEREQWRSMALSTTAHSDGERVQSSGSQQKMADAICRYIDIENDINSRIDALVDKRNEVIEVIEQLDEPEYNLLHCVYVQYIALHDVPEVIGKSYSWATTMHGRALAHVQEILDGKAGAKDE